MEKYLRNAPITEALLDIRVELVDEFSLDTLDAVHAQLRQEYPTKRDRVDFAAKFDAEARALSMESVRNTGFLFWSEDGRQVVQARLDGFSFSRLRPYGRWQTLVAEAKRLWSIYQDVANPKRITRVGLRYINRLELPVPVRLKDYLTTYPTLSNECPEPLSELFMRLVTERDEDRIVISEALGEKKVGASHVPLILDIDVFREVDLPLSSEQAAWKALEQLRVLKNEVFFSTLTPLAEEMFE